MSLDEFFTELDREARNSIKTYKNPVTGKMVRYGTPIGGIFPSVDEKKEMVDDLDFSDSEWFKELEADKLRISLYKEYPVPQYDNNVLSPQEVLKTLDISFYAMDIVVPITRKGKLLEKAVYDNPREKLKDVYKLMGITAEKKAFFENCYSVCTNPMKAPIKYTRFSQELKDAISILDKCMQDQVNKRDKLIEEIVQGSLK